MKPIKNLDQRKQRYMLDAIPVRLGGIAANLARVKSFSQHDDNSDAVFQLLDESKYYIEWTGRELDTEMIVRLIELQRQIAGWQYNWQSVWPDKDLRGKMINETSKWSSMIIMSSGLLDQ